MKKLALLAVVVMAVMIQACGGGASFDAAQLKEGMSQDEVKALFGEPTMTMTVMGKTTWSYGDNDVYFGEDGTVTMEAHGSLEEEMSEGLNDLMNEVEEAVEDMGEEVETEVEGAVEGMEEAVEEVSGEEGGE